jgi:hypothetical protein
VENPLNCALASPPDEFALSVTETRVDVFETFVAYQISAPATGRGDTARAART